MSIAVAIVEDDRRLRERLVSLLDADPGFHCVGAYMSAEEAINKLPEKRPDVVLMDLDLPGMSGAECTFRLKRIQPSMQVLVLTVYDDDERIFEALEAGATGYLLKRTPPSDILAALADMHAGGAPMSSSVARRVVQSFSRKPGQDAPELAPREEEVLALVSKGYINKEIARMLGLSVETVRSYLKNIYKKLHVRSRTEAAMKYYGTHPERTEQTKQ